MSVTILINYPSAENHWFMSVNLFMYDFQAQIPLQSWLLKLNL